MRGVDCYWPAETAGQRERDVSIGSPKIDVEGRAVFTLTIREDIMLFFCFFFLRNIYLENPMTETYDFGMDTAIVTAQFHGDSFQLVVSGHPYVASDGSARRVK